MTAVSLYKLPAEQAQAVLALAAASLRHKQRQIRERPSWRTLARAEQIPPDGPWRTWYVRGGRGGGKTWTGAHTLAEMAEATPGEYGAVGPTYADARDTCVEGPSGLLAALGTNRGEVDRGSSRLVSSWNRSMGDVRMRNGSVIWADGADDGALRIQGKNLRGLWADEVGLWRRWRTAWEESIRYAVRLAPARIVATGTPKRGHALVRSLMADEGVPKTLLRTMDNIANLDPSMVEEWFRLYGDTTLGRQELGGELIEEAEGALWKRNLIRYGDTPMQFVNNVLVPRLVRIVVAVDPAVTANPDSDETGIVVAGLSAEKDAQGRSIAYVLDDRSLMASPHVWAGAAVNAYRDHRADRIVPEVNNGGDMVALTIGTVDGNVPVKPVHASQGKRTRAEPVSALYEQGRIFHVRPFPELEDQMCNWDPEVDADSPDRVDALVWALTDLLITGSWGGGHVSSGVA